MKILVRRKEAMEMTGLSDYSFRKLVSARVIQKIVVCGRKGGKAFFRSEELLALGKK